MAEDDISGCGNALHETTNIPHADDTCDFGVLEDTDEITHEVVHSSRAMGIVRMGGVAKAAKVRDN